MDFTFCLKKLTFYGTKWLLDPPGVQKTLNRDELSAIDDFETALPPQRIPPNLKDFQHFLRSLQNPSVLGGLRPKISPVFA